ncbi:MAG: hypothetical protein RSC93_06370 [Erysipelotrichaceae bacterium]
MNKNKPRVHVGLGVATIFMVFTILCFTILATLSYMSAQSQNDTSIEYDKNMKDYYVADLKANQIEADIYKNLNNLEAFCEEKGYYYNKDTKMITYIVKMNRYANLKIELAVENEDLVVKQWMRVNK